MFIGYEVAPDRLGVRWGFSSAECLKNLNENAVLERISERWIAITWNDKDVTLEFSEPNELNAVKLLVHKSQDFYDADMSVVEEVGQAYYKKYQYLRKEAIFSLGTPYFSGRWGEVGFPEDSNAFEISYWELPQGRLQIEYEHQDRELPVCVYLVWYRPSP